MTGLDLELAFGQVLNLDLAQIFLTLVLAFVLGIGVAATYLVASKSRVVPSSLVNSLVLLSVIGSMVMLVIGNNLARAFSLVGALAIIRFRTRLKSPWDITFVFYALAVGIACGVLAYRVAIMGALVVFLAVLILDVLPLGTSRTPTYRLRCDLAAYEGAEGIIAPVLDTHLRRRWLVEVRSLRFGETLSYRYRVCMKDPSSYDALLRALSDVEGVERVVLEPEDEGQGMDG